ncbi:hypothetical protein [Thermogymnomonas acidicola]|uniref:hypothetical protein n=1 Tax=Thermogymnomonas acidicola TaxID=399579 RepID=UPI001396BAB9|nr:hypothetical protein [Thermogymnomonas acidicola]
MGGEDRGGSVTLRFSVDGKEYEVHRELERSKRGGVQQTGNSYIVADGRKQVLSATELRSKVIEILGFNEPQSSRSRSLIFRYAVFTPTGGDEEHTEPAAGREAADPEEGLPHRGLQDSQGQRRIR